MGRAKDVNEEAKSEELDKEVGNRYSKLFPQGMRQMFHYLEKDYYTNFSNMINSTFLLRMNTLVKEFVARVRPKLHPHSNAGKEFVKRIVSGILNGNFTPAEGGEESDMDDFVKEWRNILLEGRSDDTRIVDCKEPF